MKFHIKTIHFLFFVGFALTFYSFAQQKSLAEAKLEVNSYTAGKDSVISLGILINLKDDWHIYWRNPGDSGLPTVIDFALPEEFKVSEIKFPVPKIFYSDEIVNYGYAHQVLLLADLYLPKNYIEKEIIISAKITSLICNELCKAFDTTATITLDLSRDFVADNSISALFNSTKNNLPKKIHKLNITAQTKSNITFLRASLNQDQMQDINNVQFYPYEEGIFKNSVKQKVIHKENYFEILLEADPFRIKEPSSLNGILILDKNFTNNLSLQVYEIEVPIIDYKN